MTTKPTWGERFDKEFSVLIYSGDKELEGCLMINASVHSLKAFISEVEKLAEERGRKFGNEENARVKNSGRILYQTGFKDGRTQALKEAAAIFTKAPTPQDKKELK